MNQQRILIVLADGKFQGASITNDKGDPQPLDLDALELLVPSINTAALSEIDATAAKIANLDAIAAAIADPAKDDVETLDAIKSAIADSELTDVQRKIAEITKQRDELNAELVELAAMQ